MSSSITCAACGKLVEGEFVGGPGAVFHLNCFKCMDCGEVVASEYLLIEGQDGRQHPLCERDYYGRLNLICAKCDLPLRGSYITACNKKFHVWHFTCSLCSTLFGPQDKYYEYEGDVYCHFHYSTRIATKCAGCNTAVLRRFVEINRNTRDECWHPDCYMINKFWNVKIVSKRPTSLLSTEGEESEPAYVEEEQRETPISLREKQNRMDRQVYRIWTVLSGFEESSAACILGVLQQVSNGHYLDAIRLAEKFVVHVEVLFAAIEDLEYYFTRLHLKGMSHVLEARMLCSKTVELFTLLSQPQDTGARRIGMTQELLTLATGLAHYLKILIRIALTGALKLEQKHNVSEAMNSFLDKLHSLATQGANTSTQNHGTHPVIYASQALAPANAGDSPFKEWSTKPSSTDPPSDLCVKCNLPIEEDCIRLGTYQRWHSHCVQCAQCGEVAGVPLPPPKELHANGRETEDQSLKLTFSRHPPANAGVFTYDPESIREMPSFGEVPTVILCTDHAHAGCRGGFQPVERLEQYAFLLNVAVHQLYPLSKKQDVIPRSPAPVSTGYDSPATLSSDPVRRKASVHLDRKLSGTARLAKRPTIVKRPTGSSAPSDATSLNPHLEQAATQDAQQVNQAPHSQSYQDGTPTPEYSTLFPNDPVSQAPGRLICPPFARNETEIMIMDDSSPSSPEEDHSPVLANEEGIALADIPRLLEAAQTREQKQSFVCEQRKETRNSEEISHQETGRSEQDQIVARRGEKEQEGELELHASEIVASSSQPEQVELRKREDEVYRRQKVEEKEEADREEAARKEQETLHHEQEERNSQLVTEARKYQGGRSRETTNGAERSKTEQEPTKGPSSNNLSNILHRNWASKARVLASSRSSFSFSRNSSVSYSTFSEQDDDTMMGWERRQEEIYERQRDQFRREQERFELL